MGYDLFLESAGPERVKVMATLKSHLRITTPEAKSLVDSCPCWAARNLTHQDAASLLKALKAIGANATVDGLESGSQKKQGVKSQVNQPSELVGQSVTTLTATGSKFERLILQHAFSNPPADEIVIAMIQASRELDGTDPSWLLFTQYRFALGKTPKRFSSPTLDGFFARTDLVSLEIGESTYTQHRGFQSALQRHRLTFRLNLSMGRRFERHAYLGTTEAEFNERMPGLLKSISHLSYYGYPCVSGAGLHAAGGTSASFGTGFGIWGG